LPIFYRELLSWLAELSENVDPDRGQEYILWSNKEILIEGKTVFYRHYFDNRVTFTQDLLYDMSNIESFKVIKEQGLTNSNFLVWTGLRQSVPLKLRVNTQNFNTVIDLENYKCKNYYYYLIKFRYEKSRKWDKLCREFDLREDQLSEAYLLPLRVASEPYVRSFQYNVLNYILYTNELLFKIGYPKEGGGNSIVFKYLSGNHSSLPV